jgi:TctA family transporter
MLDSLIDAVAMIADPSVMVIVLAAVLLGLVFGVLPGIGGLTGLAILIPHIYGMEPIAGLCFLMATHAVIYTGGSVTAILFGIPGSVANAATILDGHPLARRGRAGYAIGAALAASALGGVVGVVILVILIPVLKSVVKLIGSPETFLLGIVGVMFMATVGRGGVARGLIGGGFGMFLATFGYQAITGVPRYWLGIDYLLDGFRLVPLILGLFAVPEIAHLMSKPAASARAEAERVQAVSWRSLMLGAWFVVMRPWLFLRSAMIGAFVGIVPGIGGETAPFVAYAAAKHRAHNARRFGSGVLAGVIAPEASNNAKEGGALVPTLGFGVPGSAAMSILLGSFLILGLEPGPSFLSDHADMAYALALTVAVANVIGALVLFPVAGHLARLGRIPGHVLGPVLLTFILLGAYASANNIVDVVFVLIFGALGSLLLKAGISRAAVLLGFVLGPTVETYFGISWNAFGPAMFVQPGALVILIAVCAVAGLLFWRRIRSEAAE